jgi:hypothetical protein
MKGPALHAFLRRDRGTLESSYPGADDDSYCEQTSVLLRTQASALTLDNNGLDCPFT